MRTKDMKCVICGKKAGETGSAIMTMQPHGMRRRALAHLDCYGQDLPSRRWTEWLCVLACGHVAPEPEYPCPDYLKAPIERHRELLAPLQESA